MKIFRSQTGVVCCTLLTPRQDLSIAATRPYSTTKVRSASSLRHPSNCTRLFIVLFSPVRTPRPLWWQAGCLTRLCFLARVQTVTVYWYNTRIKSPDSEPPHSRSHPTDYCHRSRTFSPFLQAALRLARRITIFQVTGSSVKEQARLVVSVL